jgi:hypothetical protein
MTHDQRIGTRFLYTVRLGYLYLQLLDEVPLTAKTTETPSVGL